MKYCNKCNVSVRGDLTRCPLCQMPLTGEDSGGPCYPKITTVYKQYQLFFKILIFFTVIAAVFSAAFNLILPNTGRWSLVVIAGIACFWVSMYLAIRQRHSLPKNITWQAVFMSLFSILIDFLTQWNGWSLCYVLPFVFIIAMVSMAVLAMLMKIPAGEYLICLILDIIFGLAPIVFYLIGILEHPVPSIFCASCSIICLTGIILFQGKEIVHELTRRFHV